MDGNSQTGYRVGYHAESKPSNVDQCFPFWLTPLAALRRANALQQVFLYYKTV